MKAWDFLEHDFVNIKNYDFDVHLCKIISIALYTQNDRFISGTFETPHVLCHIFLVMIFVLGKMDYTFHQFTFK